MVPPYELIVPTVVVLASGELPAGARVLLADVHATAGDSVVARALTEALRADMAASSGATIVTRSEVDDALRRMARPAALPLSDSLARELSRRNGYAAVVSVAFTPVGSGFLLSAQIRDGTGARELASLTERASSADDLLSALNRLSKDLRGRLGERAQALRGAPPLERVTTASLEALQLYSDAMSEERTRGETGRMRTLLRDAIAKDSTFSMALRRLAILQSNGGALTEAVAPAERARRYSDASPDAEREYTLGTYYAVRQDQARAVEHYRAGLRADSTNVRIRSNLGVALATLRRFDESLAEARVMRALDSTSFAYLESEALFAQGRADEAIAAAKRVLSTARRPELALRQYALVLASGGMVGHPAGLDCAPLDTRNLASRAAGQQDRIVLDDCGHGAAVHGDDVPRRGDRHGYWRRDADHDGGAQRAGAHAHGRMSGLLKLDESRHIAYGLYLLSRLTVTHGDAVWSAVTDTMQTLLDPTITIIAEAFDAYPADAVPFGLSPEPFVDFAMGQFARRTQVLERAAQDRRIDLEALS